jgi:hypothetical protein
MPESSVQQMQYRVFRSTHVDQPASSPRPPFLLNASPGYWVGESKVITNSFLPIAAWYWFHGRTFRLAEVSPILGTRQATGRSSPAKSSMTATRVASRPRRRPPDRVESCAHSHLPSDLAIGSTPSGKSTESKSEWARPSNAAEKTQSRSL